MMKPHYILLILTAIIFCCTSNPSAHFTYHPPENIHDGLRVASLDDVQINPALLISLTKDILDDKFSEVHSILILKDNKLVFEEYFPGHRFAYENANHHGDQFVWKRDSLHRMMSVSKSITSACIGIAVDQGFILNVHQSIFDYLPEYRHLNDDGKDKITIEHLLTMTSGLKGNEWLVPYSNPKNDVIEVYFSEDPLETILEKPLLHTPGEYFQYYGGSNFLLGEILRNASKLNLDSFSKKYLFDPLGIAPYEWLRLNKDVIDGAGGLILTPRDMAKIGLLFLNKGVWNEKRILPEDWIKKSAFPYPGNSWMNSWDDHWGMRGYACSWWTHTFSHVGKKIDMYYAAGWGGQYIMIIPELNTVVVFTGGNYTTSRPCFGILKNYILPAYQ